MRPLFRGAVISLALSASLLTGVARADDANGGGTPLNLRGSKTALSSESAPTNIVSLLAKIGVVVMLGGAGAWWFLRKKQADTKTSSARKIKIVTRTSVGMRQDLVWVEVAGQQLLLGVTPSQITTLAELENAPMIEDESMDSNEPARAGTPSRKAPYADAPPRNDPPARSSCEDAFEERLERSLSVDRGRREVTREPLDRIDDEDHEDHDDDHERSRPSTTRDPARRSDHRGQVSLHERVVALLDRTREQEDEASSRKPRLDLEASRPTTRDEAARPHQDPSPATVEGQARGLLRRRG